MSLPSKQIVNTESIVNDQELMQVLQIKLLYYA